MKKYLINRISLLLSPELKTIGLHVIISGPLKKFNSDENMTPEIAGQGLYFFETSQITKKQKYHKKFYSHSITLPISFNTIFCL